VTKSYLKYRARITVLSCFIILTWSLLCARLFQIQVLDKDLYAAKGVSQGIYTEVLNPSRGNIYDRNNVPLTRNISHITLCGNSSEIAEKKEVAKLLSECSGKLESYYLNKLSKTKSFVYLERNIRESQCLNLSKLKKYGVIVKQNHFRHYPFGNTGGQLIGFTDPDNIGISGIEKHFNGLLTGVPGLITKKRSGTGKRKIDNSLPITKSKDGFNIQLTLDIEYQSILEDELSKQLNVTEGKSATGILMDPETGEILAIASLPNFDPNRPNEFPIENQKNKAITDQFEPGSTFKVVSATAALNEKKVNIDDEFFCENGSFFYNDHRIRDHEEYGLLTFSQVLEQSSNVGIIKITELLQNQLFYQYIRKYGFGIKTDIKLPGESSGSVRNPDSWSKISPGVFSMGQGISVTALQLASAYSAIANGGYLLQPRVVKQVLKSDGTVKDFNAANVVRKVADSETINKLIKILTETVRNGTASNAKVSGWSVAGKTGTAQKFINGSYSETKFISNFAGFFPAEKPKLLGVFLIDEPKLGFHWGSTGAAPIFRRVAQRVINMDESFQYDKKIKLKNSENKLWASNGDNHSTNLGNPFPLSHSLDYSTDKKECIVPDVRQMSLLKAVRQLKQSGFNYSTHGSGIVNWQSPKPGKVTSCGSICVVGLK